MRALRKQLVGILTKEELKKLNSGVDIIGDIAIIDIAAELEKKEKKIAQVLMQQHKHLVTVCKKAGVRSGQLRKQQLRIIAGKRSKETLHKENGLRFKLHVQDCYFSPRLSTERKELIESFKKKETDMLVLFSGVGPYVIQIAKHHPQANVIGIELNKKAHQYALENAQLNKVKQATFICADAAKAIEKLAKFDRILMPLPKYARNFLEAAYRHTKKGGVVHYYFFSHDDLLDEEKAHIKELAKQAGKKIRIQQIIICGAYGPQIYRRRADIKVLN